MSGSRASRSDPEGEEGGANSRALGFRLREMRERHGLTLKEVSLRSGIPVSTLSKVQNHQLSLNYENLVRLSAGLGIDIGELFRSDPVDLRITRRAINLAGGGVVGASERYRYEILATELSHKKLVPGVLTVTATTLDEVGGLSRHEGEEFIFVLEGAVALHTEFYTPVVLNRGDSAYLDSTMGHAYLLASGRAFGEAKLMAVCSHAAIEI